MVASVNTNFVATNGIDYPGVFYLRVRSCLRKRQGDCNNNNKNKLDMSSPRYKTVESVKEGRMGSPVSASVTIGLQEASSAFKRYRRSSAEEREDLASQAKRGNIDIRRDLYYPSSVLEGEGRDPSRSPLSACVRTVVPDDSEASDCRRKSIISSSTGTLPFVSPTASHRELTASSSPPHSSGKQPKMTLIVHPQPRLATTVSLHSNPMNPPSQLAAYLAAFQQLLQYPQESQQHMSAVCEGNSHVSTFHSVEDKQISMSNLVINTLHSDMNGSRDEMPNYSPPSVSSPPTVIKSRSVTVSRPQTPSAPHFQASDNAVFTGDQQPFQDQLLNSRNNAPTTTYTNSGRRCWKYTEVNLTKRTATTWSHKRVSTASRVHQNSSPYAGHECEYYQSGRIPSSDPQEMLNKNENYSSGVIEIKIIDSNELISRLESKPPSRQSTSNENSYPDIEFTSPPPNLERVNDSESEVNFAFSEGGTRSPPELEPEIVKTENINSKEKVDGGRISQMETENMFPTLNHHLAPTGNHSKRLFSWSSEDTSWHKGEVDQAADKDKAERFRLGSNSESTVATSVDGASPETNMEGNYDSDASIDVGSSYGPDPELPTVSFDNDDEDDAFYDCSEGEVDPDEEDDEKCSGSSERFSRGYIGSSRQDLLVDGYNMGAVITSSPLRMETVDEGSLEPPKTSSELKRKREDDSKSSGTSHRFVIVGKEHQNLLSDAEWKGFSVFQRANRVEVGSSNYKPFKFRVVNQEDAMHIKQEHLMKQKTSKGVKSRGVYRELGMRNISENSEDLGEFYPNSSVVCKDNGSTCTIKSPMVLLKDCSSSKIVIVSESEVSDQELVFSPSDTALRCRMLVVLWALLGEGRLRQVGFPQEPVHRILWRTVDVCCSVAGVKSAAAVPLPSDHDCGRDMVCFRDHAHRFLEVCAPTREHWKRFGWASLTVDAVVRKIYVGEILPALQFYHSAQIPELVRHVMDVLTALEKASDQQRMSRGRFILPKAPLPPEQGSSSTCVRPSTTDLEPVKKKRGRPAKLANKTDVGRVERVMLWRFLLNLLEDQRNAPCIHWVKREEGIFRILNTDWLARLWGRRHGNPRMTYEKMARAMRTYYRSKVLQPVPRSPNLPRKLVYKFNPAVIQKVAAAKLAALAASTQGTTKIQPRRDLRTADKS